MVGNLRSVYTRVGDTPAPLRASQTYPVPARPTALLTPPEPTLQRPPTLSLSLFPFPPSASFKSLIKTYLGIETDKFKTKPFIYRIKSFRGEACTPIVRLLVGRVVP